MTSRRTLFLLTSASAATTYSGLRLRDRWHRAQRLSHAVRNWWPGRGDTVRFGRVVARATPGTTEHTTILLHGLGTASDYWGGAWDRCAEGGNTLLVPDLFGFGRSGGNPRVRAEQFDMNGHIIALDAMVKRARGRITVAGHSMGAVLALGLAARHADRVDRVVLFGPPLHDSAAEAQRFILTRGWFARYFALDRRTAQLTWRLVCRFPQIARRCGKLTAPWMPTPVAERVAGHSWNSYVGTLRGLLHAPGWRASLAVLQSYGVEVVIAVGNRDRTIDRELINGLDGVTVVEHPDAGHQLPIMDPAWCADLVCAPVDPSAAAPPGPHIATA